MADVDILALVKFHVKPALLVDSTLEEDLPILINASRAQQGWADPLTDAQATYVAAVTLEAMIPRLALIFTQEVQEQRTGPETVRLPNRAEFFRVLLKAIAAMKETAAGETGKTNTETAEQLLNPWPGCGIARW